MKNGSQESIPTGWRVSRLDSFCVLQRGFDITKKDQVEGEIPVVSSGGISSFHNTAKVTGPGVVIGRKGTLGTVHFIGCNYWPHDTTLWVKDFKGNDPRFAAYLLESLKLKRFDTGAANPTLNRNLVHGEEITYPPLPEQKNIAHILSTVQRAIEAQERIIQTTTELKKALMHKLFTEGLRHEPQKQTEIGPVPASWATPTVESVCTIKASAMSYSQLENASNVANGVNVIGIKVSDMNLPGNEIEFRSANLERQLPEKEALKRTVPTNSIVFPKRGAAIATNKKRLTTGWTVLDPNLIAVMPTKVVNHRYLFHWFNTFDLKKITDPGPTPQLNKKDIAPLKFPMPPIEEQEAIAAAIDAAEVKATLHIRKRDQFQYLFRTLLHELMTAKTRVHKLEIHA
jgi:type I restriction enzyme S subunit